MDNNKLLQFVSRIHIIIVQIIVVSKINISYLGHAFYFFALLFFVIHIFRYMEYYFQKTRFKLFLPPIYTIQHKPRFKLGLSSNLTYPPHLLIQNIFMLLPYLDHVKQPIPLFHLASWSFNCPYLPIPCKHWLHPYLVLAPTCTPLNDQP